MARDAWKSWGDSLSRRRREGDLERALRAVEPIGATSVRSGDDELVVFSSNDYLGLSMHPAVRRAASQALDDHGMGPRGSALVCGHTTGHAALSEELAALEGTDRALLTPTGYAANVAVLAALGDPETTIFSDELNHASIIDGCRLARRNGATVRVYRHGDAGALDESLSSCETPRRLIVTDGVFSMDGDLAPLAALAELAERHDALLVVDEAHGTLVFGERGAGAAEHAGVKGAVDLTIGTMSKAFGAQGGFLAADAWLIETLLHRARPLIYSTALPSPIIAAARAALRLVASPSTDPRPTLWRNVARFGELIGRELQGPIVPIVVGGADRALSLGRELLDAGFHVVPIRPPTVPRGTSRLRVALSAAHTEEQLTGLAQQLHEIGAITRR